MISVYYYIIITITAPLIILCIIKFLVATECHKILVMSYSCDLLILQGHTENYQGQTCHLYEKGPCSI